MGEGNDGARKTLVNIEKLGGPCKLGTLNCYRVLAKKGGPFPL